MGPTLYFVPRNNVFWLEISPNRKATRSFKRMDVKDWGPWDTRCGVRFPQPKTRSYFPLS
jgi:hypothetical protein